MNQNFKTLLNTMRDLFFVFMLLITSIVQGQELRTLSSENEFRTLNENPYKTISFGESIKLNNIDTSSKWTIESNDLGLHIELDKHVVTK